MRGAAPVKHAHDQWVDAIPVHGRLIIINVRVFLQDVHTYTPRIRIVFWCNLSIDGRNNWSGYTSKSITPQKKGTVAQHKATREGVHITITSIIC